MDIVVIMDAPETVDPATDTSFGLMLAAEERGHRVWHCLASDIEFVDGSVRARARVAHADQDADPPLRLGESNDLDLGRVGAVLVRTDPAVRPRLPPPDAAARPHRPAPRSSSTHPRGLRDANEKLYACRFPDITPPTIVTSDPSRLTAFARTHAAAVVKPIEGHGGRGVMVLRDGDANMPSIIDTMTSRGHGVGACPTLPLGHQRR